MQVTELESKGLKKNFKLVVNADKISSQTEKELRAAGEKVKIPGFRPGFIPMKILQQRYGKSVQSDVLKQVINEASGQVISERKLRPAMMPQINIEDYKEGGDLAFTMSFETFPELPAIDFKGVTLDRKTFEIEEKDIDEAVKTITERSPELKRAKSGGKAALGQTVVIDFKGMIDGVAFDGGTASDFKLDLGSGQFIEGFEDQLVGAKEGEERNVNVSFPENYPGAPNLAGKAALFEVKVKEIHDKETPEADDAFAKARGFADARALREAVRNQMIREYDQVVRTQLKKQLFDVMEETYDFELPEGMVEQEFKSIWERHKQAMAQGQEAEDGKDEKEQEDEYRQIARRRVKLGLLLAEIGNSNKIQISREELSRAVMQQAGQFPGQERQVMEFYRDHPERMEDLRGPILEEKAVDHILSKVAFNDSKATLAELAGDDDEEESESARKKPQKKAAGSETKKAAAKKKSAAS